MRYKTSIHVSSIAVYHDRRDKTVYLANWPVLLSFLGKPWLIGLKSRMTKKKIITSRLSAKIVSKREWIRVCTAKIFFVIETDRTQKVYRAQFCGERIEEKTRMIRYLFKLQENFINEWQSILRVKNDNRWINLVDQWQVKIDYSSYTRSSTPTLTRWANK